MSYTEEQLKQAVDQIFIKYDKDHSGFLDFSESTQIVYDALKSMNTGRQPTEQDVKDLLDAADENKDQKISKEELLNVFKKFANQ